MTRIVICGIRGRMGRTVVELAGDAGDMEVVGGIAREVRQEHIPVAAMADAAALLERADVVIDFSSAAGTHALLEQHASILAGRALVVGTTGLAADTQNRLQGLAAQTAVLTAANFSVGVNLLLALVERAAAALPADAYDIEIVEAHHRRKVDAPSGTALVLAAAAAAGRGAALDDARRDGRSGQTGARPEGEIGMHAVRGGGTVGEHTVLFMGERERIELRHEALDRALFAEGALRAARWLASRPPGTYGMNDVLGI